MLGVSSSFDFEIKPCSSKKEGRKKGLSSKKSRYGTHVWIL